MTFSFTITRGHVLFVLALVALTLLAVYVHSAFVAVAFGVAGVGSTR